jgi:hypothetical protein
MLDRIAAESKNHIASLSPKTLAAYLKNTAITGIDERSWLRLMMAVHHATGGWGREQFVEWSIADLSWSRRRVEALWDSLNAGEHDPVCVDAHSWRLLAHNFYSRRRRRFDARFALSDFHTASGAYF